MTVTRGLDAILSGGTEFLTFEENKPKTLLIIDWYEDLVSVREHYEPSLNPKYIRCPGKDVCPLCHANPDKYAGVKVKFRVYDPAEDKVKVVSLAKKHIKKLNADFNIDEIDPTKEYVTIHRTGKDANDTSYSARLYRPDESKGKPAYAIPDFDDMDMPDLEEQVKVHTPEQIQGFMNALLAGVGAGGQDDGGQQYEQAPQGNPTAGGRKMPF
jgi:hypothetical protein